MRVAALVLAAGEGRRFRSSGGETHKLLAPFRGRPLVLWALQHAIEAELDAVIVVQGAIPLGEVMPPGVRLVENERFAAGQATSLAVGVAAAGSLGCDAIVVGLGDQPFLSGAAWRAVADAGAAGTHPIVVATYDGRRGQPVFLHRSVWPLLPTSGDEGARRVIAENPTLVLEVACDPASEGLARRGAVDIDTVEDLHRWS